jgi:hypothetical protein
MMTIFSLSGLSLVVLVLMLVFLRCWRLEKRRQNGGFVSLNSSDAMPNHY